MGLDVDRDHPTDPDLPKFYRTNSMKNHREKLMVLMTVAAFVYGCGSGSSGGTMQADTSPPTSTTGNVSISLTDGPWEDAMEMVLHVTGIEMGHSDGRVVAIELNGGPISIDMMQLQNGESHLLADNVEVPVGHYDWMRLMIDPGQSHFDLASTGGHHNMHMGGDATEGLEVHHPFEIVHSVHGQFMLDFDMRRGVQHHGNGMMGGEYRLHSAMRLIDMAESGGLMGVVHPSMIDVNHPACDDAPGGNWAYLYHGDVMEPDDIAVTDSDGLIGPIAADRIELDNMTGEHRYHFGYLEPGHYRIAVTCSSEWDELGDDDYPSDPDGRFAFHMFSDPMEVMSGQMHHNDLNP